MKKGYRKMVVNSEMSMEVVREKKLRIMSLEEFAITYADGVTNQALDYAMKKGRIDWIRLGRFRSIVLTQKTLLYKPTPSVLRKPRKSSNTIFVTPE